MCTVSECASMTSKLLVSGGAAVFNAFVEPVISYCWFFRAPGDPCPANPTMDYLYRFKDKTEYGVRARGVSLLGANATQAREKRCNSPFHKWKCHPTAMCSRGVTTFCPTICRAPEFQNALHTAIMTILWTGAPQDEKKGIAYVAYDYNPGWPVPEPPKSPTTAPEPPATSSPQPTTTASTALIGEATASPDETTGTTLPSSRPRPTKQAPSGSQAEGSQTDVFDQGMKPEEIFNRSEPLTSRVPNNASAPVKPTSGPAVADSQTTSDPKTRNHATILVAGVAAVITVLLVAVFVYISGNRRSAVDKIDDSYSTVDSPLSSGHHVVATTRTRDDIEVVLGLKKLLPVKQIKDIRMISSGGYGVVYLVRDTLNNRLLASKRLVQNKITDDKINDFFDEIKTVSVLKHPCVVTFVGATWTNRTDVQALFEYMDGGDLRTYLDTAPMTGVWTSEKLTIAVDIAHALVYVHSELPEPLVHRDIKSPLRAKLSDFGEAREVSQNESMTNGVGTSRWLAPEVILGRGDYGTACDIYSFGAVLSELDTHKIPFWDCGGDDPDAMLPEITIMRMVAMEGCQPTFSASCPSAVLHIARLCLAHDPEQRPTAAVVGKMLRDIIE